jgi:thiamine biosynthesis lipoprotein
MLRVEHSFTAMGGPCRLRLDVADESRGKAAVDSAVAEVQRLEFKYSRYREDSLTSKINRAAGSGSPVAIDPETAGILHYADTVWHESNGMFDLTSGVLRRAWDFRSKRLPSKSDIDSLLPLVNWSGVIWDEKCISLPLPDMEIDFGGCVKEYAVDSVVRRLRESGVRSALVDLAGDMSAIGAPPGEVAWTIGIRNPGNREAALASVDLADASLASSGDYERCIELDGRRYGHILNPRTGWPVEGLVAVSILAPQCLVAGSSATMAMLQPEERALQWLSELGLPWFAVDAQLHTHGSVI